MEKILTIIRREFLVRLRSKGFVVATLVGPLALVVLMLAPIFVLQWASDDSEKSILVIDQTGVLYPELHVDAPIRLARSEEPVDSLRGQVLRNEITGYIVLPAGLLEEDAPVMFYSLGGGELSLRMTLESAINQAVRSQRLLAAGAPAEVVDILNRRVGLDMKRVTGEGDTRDDTSIMAVVGYVMGFVIYLTVFIYGSLVMRGVIEEKVSRIMEVVVSSARPFELMLGKVLGIGALGLVQMLIWVVITLALVVFGGAFAASLLDPADLNLPDTASQQAVLDAADLSIPQIPLSLFVYFVLFFVGGYLLYAALFAAVGSAVDQEADAQQFVLPVAAPVILAIIFITVVIDQPNSTVSTIVSLIPLFSPILMVVRLAVTQVPLWQSLLSLMLLAMTVLGTVWVAARIYRVGILMYGKKPSFRDLARWVRMA